MDLNTQNNVLEAMFEATDCGMMRHTLDGSRIISINRAALEILGYSSEYEMMQDGFNIIASSVVEEDRGRLIESIRGIQKVGDSISLDYRIQHKDGEIRNVIGRIKLLEENGVKFYQRFLVDCTAQKYVEKQREYEKNLFHIDMIRALSTDFSSVYYLNLDTDIGFPYRLNEDMIERYGNIIMGEIPLKEGVRLYAENEVLDSDRELFIEVTSHDNFISELSEKPVFYHNYQTYRNGVIEYYQLKAVRVGSWEKSHNAVVGFRSIDDETRHNMRQQRKLSEALAQAEKASKAKTTFLNNMSHDIRTPMNAIIGYTSLALGHHEDTELIKDYLEKIMVSSNHLLALINDILDMSRIESGKITLNEDVCSLYDVCDDLNSILAANMSEKDLHYNVELNISNPIVVCDKMRLNQILLNCIGNAVKFTNPNGTIDFSITQKGWLSDDRAMYEFKVRDDGIGMSEDFSKHIFEPFERERTSTVSGIQGTGLGMAITKSIVDMMKGTITVESEIGKGTEFVISLPLKISSQELKAIEPLNDGKAEIAPDGCKVLLVEDIEMNREIAKVVLEEAGFEVDMARNGKEAVDKVFDAAPDRYDVILMDIQMPVMDGYQACTKIRQMDGKKAEIPIVAMTANAFEEDRQRASGVGMDGYLTKPLKADELCKTIISILKS